MQRLLRYTQRSGEGQALILVALALGLLVTLIVGVNDVALRRRTQARVQDSLDQAAGAAVGRVAPASLVADTPALLSHDAEARFRTVLRAELMRVGAAISPDPSTLAQHAHVTIVTPGGSCHGHPVTGPAICADLHVTLIGVLGAPQVTFATLAQAARRP
jgi:hypothetical protein